MIDLYVALKPEFTEKDKEECRDIIRKIVHLANTARIKGVLALENEAAGENDYFLKMSVGLVVDGTDPGTVKEIMKAAIVSGNYSGAELLHRFIVASGVLALQQGENPRIILMRLTVMLGEEYMRLMENEYSPSDEEIQKYYKFMHSINGKAASPGSGEFEKVIAELGNRDIQLTLRDIAHFDISAALVGCSQYTIAKVLDNLSFNTCMFVIGTWDIVKDNSSACLRCQTEILNKVTSLQNTGEVIRRADL